MSSNRDDFSEKIKGTLAKRAGWRCSNPTCRCYTSGPHTEANKSISIGVAAHICAAAVGGPRYDKNMSTQARSSIENGIWLCQTCSRLIDTDESRYPVSLLHKWKREAEKAALNDLQSKSNSNSQDKGIPVKAQNDIVTQARILMECAKGLYKNYQEYRPC